MGCKSRVVIAIWGPGVSFPSSSSSFFCSSSSSFPLACLPCPHLLHYLVTSSIVPPNEFFSWKEPLPVKLSGHRHPFRRSYFPCDSLRTYFMKTIVYPYFIGECVRILLKKGYYRLHSRWFRWEAWRGCSWLPDSSCPVVFFWGLLSSSGSISHRAWLSLKEWILRFSVCNIHEVIHMSWWCSPLH